MATGDETGHTVEGATLKRTSKAPRPSSNWAQILSAIAASVATYLVLQFQPELLAISRSARLPLLAFHIGVFYDDPMPSRTEGLLRPDSTIYVFNTGAPMRRPRVNAISMLMLTDRMAACAADSVRRIPIFYWWKPWYRNDNPAFPNYVASAEAHNRDMRPIPYRYQGAQYDSVSRFVVRGVVHLVRLWYVDALERERYEYYVVSRTDYAPVGRLEGIALWNELSIKVAHKWVVDLRTDSTRVKDDSVDVALPGHTAVDPLTLGEIQEIGRRDVAVGYRAYIRAQLEPDATGPFRY